MISDFFIEKRSILYKYIGKLTLFFLLFKLRIPGLYKWKIPIDIYVGILIRQLAKISWIH